MDTFTGPPDPGGDPLYAQWLRRKAEWWRWHQENPEVWEYFVIFAFEAINADKKKISHWLILNRVRWEVFIKTTRVVAGDGDFKISNMHFAFYARYWKHKYPMHSGLFNTKRMVGEPDSPLIGST
jgi:hypothetical protein